MERSLRSAIRGFGVEPVRNPGFHGVPTGLQPVDLSRPGSVPDLDITPVLFASKPAPTGNGDRNIQTVL